MTRPSGGPLVSQNAAAGLLASGGAAAGAVGGRASAGGGAGNAGASRGAAGPGHPAVQLQVDSPATRSSSQRNSPPQRLHGAPAFAGTWTASRGTSVAQPGQSQPGRHAAMPVSRRIGTGAHCISRCGSRTKSTPSARPMAASRWQHSTATPGGARGSGASLEVNVRSW